MALFVLYCLHFWLKETLSWG